MKMFMMRYLRIMKVSGATAFLLLFSLSFIAMPTNQAKAAESIQVPDAGLAQIIIQDKNKLPVVGADVHILIAPQNPGATTNVDEPSVGIGITDNLGHVEAMLTSPDLTNSKFVSSDKHVNYELQATDGTGKLLADYYFTRYYGNDANMRRETASLQRTVLNIDASVHLLSLNSRPFSSIASTIPNVPAPQCNWRNTGNTWDKYTTVGELHVVPDITGDFSYGQTADSDIGVEESISKGPYKITGTWHTTTSASGLIKQTSLAPKWGHQIQTQFLYVEQQIFCTGLNGGWQQDIRIITGQWNGGVNIAADVSNWDNRPNQYKVQITPLSDFTRNTNNAFTYGTAVCIQICVSAKSGFSNNVVLHWKNTSTTQRHWLYGNDGPPTTSTIIYAAS